ncbi:hypothetical protein S101258_01877 [Lactiplantibacillus plantarum subsp. plantarum]|uniref:Uncharacterized protein n=1 Tax=Lactiplantibacillus plantarum subsp. plantarum TaxID=337330 RepID=A0A2S3U5N5_LACPN|nr:hypothetical protein S101258_01877 [Lactiplantibacillus plantarum subsp. plantarum]
MIQKTRAELKTEIKQLFKGRWKDAILLCIIISLLTIFGVMANYSDRVSSGSSTTDDTTFKQLGTLTGSDYIVDFSCNSWVFTGSSWCLAGRSNLSDWDELCDVGLGPTTRTPDPSGQ